MSSALAKALQHPAAVVAPRLLGCRLVRLFDGHELVGRIVETEAYDQTDAASHSYNDKTPRTAVMFGPAGYLYVYFTYGMHYCCNVVVGKSGEGAAVLIRAIEPLTGKEIMEHIRGSSGAAATNGPAKVCQAMHIDRHMNGHNLSLSPLRLELMEPLPAEHIVQTTRIGISRGKDVPWRFYIRGNNYVSKP